MCNIYNDAECGNVNSNSRDSYVSVFQMQQEIVRKETEALKAVSPAVRGIRSTTICVQRKK